MTRRAAHGVRAGSRRRNNSAATLRQHVQIGNGQSSPTASPQLAIPAGAAANDIVMVTINAAHDTATMTTPTNWNLQSGPNRFGGQSQWNLWKKLVAGEPGTTVTFTLSAPARCNGIATLVQGGTDTGISFATYDDSTGSSTTETPVTAGGTVNGIYVVHFSWMRNASPAPNVTRADPYVQGLLARSTTGYGNSPELGHKALYQSAAAPGSFGGDVLAVTNSSSGGAGWNYACFVRAA